MCIYWLIKEQFDQRQFKSVFVNKSYSMCTNCEFLTENEARNIFDEWN